MNFMPPQPAGRRFFTLGLIVILLWLVHFAFFAFWIYLEQVQQETRLQKAHDQVQSERMEAQDQVQKHEQFMKRYGPAITYREAAQDLRKNRVSWSQAIGIVNKNLPSGVSLIRAEGKGSRFDGWVVFSSPSEAAAFLKDLKKDPRAKDVYLDCMGRRCNDETTPNPLEGEAQIVHFHFRFLSSVKTGGE
ncbi:PilN domain-containing protein [Paludifilum halophilum]|uniref:Fimbrial assembly protein n=1 Tax=Paludifilum halophilum TaxID=1642702 RepID=A0A235B3K1_9BACL|nr:hypothetical protein [Paludifilum halophilum]OYD06205.1 hypothetical protein CHM34_17585 [Paludifilum halophilum]